MLIESSWIIQMIKRDVPQTDLQALQILFLRDPTLKSLLAPFQSLQRVFPTLSVTPTRAGCLTIQLEAHSTFFGVENPKD